MNPVYRFETKKDCKRREPEDYISMAVETFSNIASSLGKAAENFKVRSQISRIEREEKKCALNKSSAQRNAKRAPYDYLNFTPEEIEDFFSRDH